MNLEFPETLQVPSGAGTLQGPSGAPWWGGVGGVTTRIPFGVMRAAKGAAALFPSRRSLVHIAAPSKYMAGSFVMISCASYTQTRWKLQTVVCLELQ